MNLKEHELKKSLIKPIVMQPTPQQKTEALVDNLIKRVTELEKQVAELKRAHSDSYSHDCYLIN